MEREIVLLKELSPLIEEKDLQFRPMENVRTTYELMQYLSGVGEVMMRRFVKNDITPEVRQEITEYRNTLTRENFAERLDKQWEMIREYMDELTDEDLMTKEVELPWKEKMVLGAAIMTSSVKWLTSYRMELFLYLKMNGRPEISTKEAWVPKNVQAQTA